jgi:hypothetical protein
VSPVNGTTSAYSVFTPCGETTMKLIIAAACTLGLIVTSAMAKSAKTRLIAPRDRYFDAAHGPNDPYSLWFAGDYIGRDPDPAIRAGMIRER